MRTHKDQNGQDKNSWVKDPEYIVRVTMDHIGKGALETIVAENKDDCNPGRVRSYIHAMVLSKVRRMNYDTLGRICSYSSGKGAHHGKHPRSAARPRFINRTGLSDLFTDANGYDANLAFKHLKVGDLLHHIAISVMVCIVVDFMQQAKWQAEWDSNVMTEAEEAAFERDGE